MQSDVLDNLQHCIDRGLSAGGSLLYAAAEEIRQLRSHRDDLQAANTRLLLENRELKARIVGRPRLQCKHFGDQGLPLPAYAHEGDVGMDLRADLSNAVKIVGSRLTVMCDGQKMKLFFGARVIVSCGFAFAIPDGYEGQVRPRSSISRDGLHVAGAAGWDGGTWVSLGTVDQSYRGPVGICIWHLGDEPVTIEHGRRVAQLVVSPVASAVLELVDELDETVRGVGAFGSTGVR